jgi:hypothetical protein
VAVVEVWLSGDKQTAADLSDVGSSLSQVVRPLRAGALLRRSALAEIVSILMRCDCRLTRLTYMARVLSEEPGGRGSVSVGESVTGSTSRQGGRLVFQVACANCSAAWRLSPSVALVLSRLNVKGSLGSGLFQWRH